MKSHEQLLLDVRVVNGTSMDIPQWALKNGKDRLILDFDGYDDQRVGMMNQFHCL